HYEYIFFFQDLLYRKIALYFNRHLFSSPFLCPYGIFIFFLFYNQQDIIASPCPPSASVSLQFGPTIWKAPLNSCLTSEGQRAAGSFPGPWCLILAFYNQRPGS